MGPHPGRRKLLIEQKRYSGKAPAKPAPPPADKPKPPPGPAIEQKPTRAGQTLFEQKTRTPAWPPPAAKPALAQVDQRASINLTSSAPKPPPDRKPGLTAEQRQRNEARRDALAWLKRAYPDLFDYPPKPLAVGIGKTIVAAAIEAGGTKHATRAALHYWVNSHGYLAALVAPGAVRYGLDGAPVEAVDPQHQAKAARLIAEIEEAKAKRAAALPQIDPP